MSFSIEYAAASEIGKVRKSNEDNLWCAGKYLKENHVRTAKVLTGRMSAGHACFGVFDGMGGEACGETASYLAARTMDAYAGRRRSLAKMLGLQSKQKTSRELIELGRDMNRQICRYAKENRIRTMGATLAMLYADANRIWISNVGDSPIFRIHGGKMEKVSEDHVQKSSWMRKPPLMQYLGIPEDEMEIDPYVAGYEAEKGDLYLLCSDGLTDMVKLLDIERKLNACGEHVQALNEAVRDLTDLAMQRGGRDNITMIVCRVC